MSKEDDIYPCDYPVDPVIVREARVRHQARLGWLLARSLHAGNKTAVQTAWRHYAAVVAVSLRQQREG